VMAELLDCPVCDDPCQTLPPHPPTMHSSHEWWEEGEYATCQCGAEVIVDVDDGIASLELRGEAPPVLAAADIDEMNATAERLSAAFDAEDESPPFDLTEREGFQPGFVRMNRYSAEESK